MVILMSKTLQGVARTGSSLQQRSVNGTDAPHSILEPSFREFIGDDHANEKNRMSERGCFP